MGYPAMNVDPFKSRAERPLSDWETRALNRLLRTDFPGHSELIAQLPYASVVAEREDAWHGIRFDVQEPLERANVLTRVPVEGEVRDADGMPILILIHVVDGVLHELELLRADGEELKAQEPTLDDLQIRTPSLKEIEELEAMGSSSE